MSDPFFFLPLFSLPSFCFSLFPGLLLLLFISYPPSFTPYFRSALFPNPFLFSFYFLSSLFLLPIYCPLNSLFLTFFFLLLTSYPFCPFISYLFSFVNYFLSFLLSFFLFPIYRLPYLFSLLTLFSYPLLSPYFLSLLF